MKIWLLLALAWPALARERLIVVGGGELPAAAVSSLVRWSGGERARILLVHWATEHPVETDLWMRSELAPYLPAEVDTAPTAPEMPHAIDRFAEQLYRATGLLFSGGDQNNFMRVVGGHPQIGGWFRKALARGVPVFGTSAGTAVLARTMITGELDETSPFVKGGNLLGIDPSAVFTATGLGLLRGILVDQHFFKRRRENRFWSVFAKCPERLGLGVDEATAVLLEDQRWGKVVGRGSVLAVRRGRAGSADEVFRLAPGETIDLARFRKVGG